MRAGSDEHVRVKRALRRDMTGKAAVILPRNIREGA